MFFNEKDLVIANIVNKTPTNVIGGGNIIAVQSNDNKVIDFINNKEYRIINNINDVELGLYVEIISRPFKDSKRVISSDIFNDSNFEKYIKQDTEDLDNPEYIQNKTKHCYEDIYLCTDKNQKKKIIKKKLP